MSAWVLGLTGGIGSGKSLAAHGFRELGVAVVDADEAARWVVEPGRPALQAITQRYGSGILLPDGTLDRATLRERIFSDATEKRWLESLLHPLIGQEIQRFLEAAESPYAILVSPLLIESGQDRLTQRILLIDAPTDVQLQRTLVRDGISETQARAILASQASREARLAKAHDVIVNDREPGWVRQEVKRLHEVYLNWNPAHA